MATADLDNINCSVISKLLSSLSTSQQELKACNLLRRSPISYISLSSCKSAVEQTGVLYSMF